MRKEIRLICLALICALLLAIPAKATEEPEIMPVYDYVSTIQLVLDINSFTGYTRCKAEAVTTAYRPVDLELKLQRFVDGSWTTFKTWTASDTGNVIINKACFIYKDYYYRLNVKVTVYNSNGTVIETITETSSIQWYS